MAPQEFFQSGSLLEFRVESRKPVIESLLVQWEQPGLAGDLADNEVLEVGHFPSPWTSEQPTTTKHVPTLADPIQQSTLRSGKHFQARARHVSAKGVTQPAPQFLWQSMRLPKDSADCKIWLDSCHEEHDGPQALDAHDVIDTAKMLRLKREHSMDLIPTM